MTSLDSRPLRALLLLTTVGTLTAVPAQAADRLELMPDFVVTVVLLSIFIVVIFPLNRLIFQPLLQVIDEREERIEGARRRAEQVEQQAQGALHRYQESIRVAHTEVAEDRRVRLNAAREKLAGVTQQAKQEAEREVTLARGELSASLGEARNDLREAAVGLATLAAERILGRSLTK